jgi:hypothetical protein
MRRAAYHSDDVGIRTAPLADLVGDGHQLVDDAAVPTLKVPAGLGAFKLGPDFLT